MPPGTLRPFLPVLALSLSLMALAACSRPLPEEPGPEAALYRQKCGVCHQPFQPALLTAAMWRTQLERMVAVEMKKAALPFSADEKERVLDYLARNAADG